MYRHVPVFQAMGGVSWTTLRRSSRTRLLTFKMPWKRNRHTYEANEGTRGENPIGGVAHPYNAVAETESLYVKSEVLAVRRSVRRKR